MLFAVAGSQGSGKSSVLSELESRGYEVMQRKISRSILADWDVTLEDVNTNLDLSLRFQDEIIKRKYEDECDSIEGKRIAFTERTYMDSFIYYLFTFGCQESMSERISAYYDLCAMRTGTSYSGVFILPSGKFKTVADGVRGTNPQYVESVDMLMEYYTKLIIPNTYDVTELSISDRVDEIVDCVNYFTKKA